MKVQGINRNRNTTTVTICRFVQETKRMSMRAIARALKIHHRTWQRYLCGSSHPEARVKRRLMLLTRMDSYEALIQAAFDHRAIVAIKREA